MNLLTYFLRKPIESRNEPLSGTQAKAPSSSSPNRPARRWAAVASHVGATGRLACDFDPVDTRAPSHPRIPCTCASAQLPRAQIHGNSTRAMVSHPKASARLAAHGASAAASWWAEVHRGSSGAFLPAFRLDPLRGSKRRPVGSNSRDKRRGAILSPDPSAARLQRIFAGGLCRARLPRSLWLPAPIDLPSRTASWASVPPRRTPVRKLLSHRQRRTRLR